MARKHKMWDNYRPYKNIPVGDNRVLHIAIGVRDGIRYIHIHEMFKKRTDEDFKGHNGWGISIPLRIPIEEGTKIVTPFAELHEVLVDAAKELDKMELYSEENAVYVMKGK